MPSPKPKTSNANDQLNDDQLSPVGPYQLIDFGDGRKLESLAGHRIDRPCPAADQLRRGNPAIWTDVDARYDAADKRWTHHRPWPSSLGINCGGFCMPVRPTPYGHIGLFPEQAANWRWLATGRPAGHQQSDDAPPAQCREALNLFAYTGASTMALVAAGYRVAHVDAAKPNVQAARQAAAANGWDDPPIRFLVDDALKFTARELRRGRRYQTIVMDPPAYGHSPAGKAWRLERDLWPLLDNALQLLAGSDCRLLVTGHSPEVDGGDVAEYLQTNWPSRSDGQMGGGGSKSVAGLRIDAGRSQLITADQRRLDAGFFVRTQGDLRQA